MAWSSAMSNKNKREMKNRREIVILLNGPVQIMRDVPGKSYIKSHLKGV